MKRSSLITISIVGAVAAAAGIAYLIYRSRQQAPTVPQVIINQQAQEAPKENGAG